MAYQADTFTAGEVPTTAKWNKLWGNDADFDTRITQSAPVGEIAAFGGSSAPTGWLLADGSAVSRTTYAALFAIYGTTYGAGNGSTTFNLPNAKGRQLVGRDSGQTEFDVLGETGGSKTHTLTTAQIPSHTHNWLSGNGGAAGGGAFTAAINNAGFNTAAPSSYEGGGGSHPILDPYLVINYICKF